MVPAPPAVANLSTSKLARAYRRRLACVPGHQVGMGLDRGLEVSVSLILSHPVR